MAGDLVGLARRALEALRNGEAMVVTPQEYNVLRDYLDDYPGMWDHILRNVFATDPDLSPYAIRPIPTIPVVIQPAPVPQDRRGTHASVAIPEPELCKHEMLPATCGICKHPASSRTVAPRVIARMQSAIYPGDCKECGFPIYEGTSIAKVAMPSGHEGWVHDPECTP